MTSTLSHRENAERNRERILDAASALMSERGFAATTISAVCKAAEVVPPTIYWHFGDKQGLAVAVMERAAERWFEEFFVPGRAVSPVQPELVVPLFRDRPEFLRLLLLLALERRDPDDQVRAAAERIRARARQACIEFVGDQLAEISDAEEREAAARLLADFTVAQIDGIFIASQLDDHADVEGLFELMNVTLRAAARQLVEHAAPAEGRA